MLDTVSFDESGNMIFLTHSQWRDLLTSYDGDAITYDAGGNPLTYRDGITFTWKNGRQLASYEDDAYRITYDYNDSGIRVKKTVTDKVTGTVTVTENYLEGTNIIAQKITTTPRDGSASTEIIWYIYDGTGSMVGMQTVDGTYYFKKNLQGDIIAIINNNGTEVVSYRYDAWGNIISANDASNAQLAEKNPFTYRGYYRDHETGFYYLQSRYYDAEVGRFINADTTDVLHNASGISDKNIFTYCENDSVNNIDPTGCLKIPRTLITVAIDTIIWIVFSGFALSFAVLTQPIKAMARYAGKALIKAKMKGILCGMSKRLTTAVIKVSNRLVKIIKSSVGRLAPSWVKKLNATKLANILMGAIISITANSFLNLIAKNITLFLSVGGIIGAIWDWKSDKKLNGWITI